MLEDEFHQLDCKIAQQQPETEINDFAEYIESRRCIQELEIAVNEIQDTINLINNAISTAIMNSADNEQKIRDLYEGSLHHFLKKRNDKV